MQHIAKAFLAFVKVDESEYDVRHLGEEAEQPPYDILLEFVNHQTDCADEIKDKTNQCKYHSVPLLRSRSCLC